MLKIFLLLTLLFNIVSAISKDSLNTIYDDNFVNSETNKVIVHAHNGVDYYIVYTFEYKDFDNESIDEYRDELSLMAKSVLFDEIRKTNTAVKSFRLRYFTNNFWLSTPNKFILLSYIKKENVILLFSSNNVGKKEKNVVLPSKINNKRPVAKEKTDTVYTEVQYKKYIDKSIKKSEYSLLKKKDSLKEYQKLYELYRMNGDIYNANITMDKIIHLKFKSNTF
jgi:hypothetical protein